MKQTRRVLPVLCCLLCVTGPFTLGAQEAPSDDCPPAAAYNVVDFGAKGDNRALNSEAIQRAIDKACAGRHFQEGARVKR